MGQPNEGESELALDQVALERARRPIGFGGKIGRVIQIFQHYQLSQIARRGIRVAQRRLQPGKSVGLWTRSGASLNGSQSVTELANQIVSHHANHPSHAQCDIERGIFVLLNHSVDAKTCRPSADVLLRQTHLWRFQFHYHEFLLTQAANGNWQPVANFLDGWLADYAPEETKQSEDSWHPYCISRRAVVWTWLLVHASNQESSLDAELTNRLVQSLEHQAQFLSQNLEWELGGNHLIENATALAIVGGVLDSELASGWRKIARDVLAKELPNQILSHGEHFELSPMYHCQILSNLLRIEICCDKDRELKAVVDALIDPMLNFLSSILHPDREIPLFADSVFHEAPSVQQIVDVASIVGRKFDKPTGGSKCDSESYFVSQADELSVICDFGSIASPNLPAHGHCDIFNLEASVGKNRWIVDSGNFNYSDDSMRHYCRSSIGHNVVTVDDENQANIWSMFRMGKRPSVSGFRSRSDQGWSWASASHNGYADQGIEKLTRIVATNSGAMLCADVPALSANVKGENLVGYLHFHPDLELEELRLDGESRFLLDVSGHDDKRRITFFADSVSLEKGWYCEEFGKRRAGAVVRYVTKMPSGFTAWILQECPNQCEIEFRDDEIRITMGGLEDLCWKPLG